MSSDAKAPAQVTERVQRVFLYNGSALADPSPAMSAEDVKKMYAQSGFPKLTNASIVGPERKDGAEVYTFKEAVGTKG